MKSFFCLNHFWDFLKRLKKGSFGLEKRFCLGLSFIGRLFLEKTHEVYSAWANNQIPVFAGRITDYSQKGSFGLEKRFYLGLSFIGRIFLEKIHEVYSPGRITKFQCFLGGITDSTQKASLGLEKRFYLGLSFIGRIFLEKKNQVYSPGRTTRFQCSPPGANNRFPSKSFLRPWKAFLSWFELHWTYISRENTWSIFAWANNHIPVFNGRITDSP